MAKSKKLPQYVTEARMASLLSRFAKAADASFAVKLAEMEERLRSEFTVVVPPKEPTDTERAIFHSPHPYCATALRHCSEANAASACCLAAAPTDSEGAE